MPARDAIVLLHGSAAGAHGWKAVQAGLLYALPGTQIVAPDMLGYGAAPKPQPGYTIAAEVDYLTQQLDAAGVQNFHLVTHSMGTMYGLQLRLAILQRVRRMTLVDPLVYNVLREANEVESYGEMDGPYEQFQSAWPDAHAAISGFVDHWNGGGTWDGMAVGTRNFLAGMAAKVSLELRAAWDDTVTLATLAADAPPTQILVGEKTRLAPRATARLLAQAMGAQLHEIQGAGHMIPITHAQAVVAAIIAFHA